MGAGGIGTAVLLGATIGVGVTVGGGLVAVPLVAIIPVGITLFFFCCFFLHIAQYLLGQLLEGGWLPFPLLP